MMIRLLNAQMMTNLVCKSLHWNSKWLLRKPQKMLGGYFILPHPVVPIVTTAISITSFCLSSFLGCQVPERLHSVARKSNVISSVVYPGCSRNWSLKQVSLLFILWLTSYMCWLQFAINQFSLTKCVQDVCKVQFCTRFRTVRGWPKITWNVMSGGDVNISWASAVDWWYLGCYYGGDSVWFLFQCHLMPCQPGCLSS